MGHEISQFDIPDRNLLAKGEQPRADMMVMDIGEAKITRTIFGKARVRVIRERDKKRRAWLLTAFAVMVLAVAAWQGWVALQQMLNAAPPLPLSERIKVSPPVFQSEDISSTPSSSRNSQKSPTEIVIEGMATRRPPQPQQPLGLKAAGQAAAKPVTAQPSTAGKPQTAPVAPSNNTAKNQADMQQPAKPAAPAVAAPPVAQPVSPAVAPPTAAQPEPVRPAGTAPVVAPPAKVETARQSPSGDNSPPPPPGQAQP